MHRLRRPAFPVHRTKRDEHLLVGRFRYGFWYSSRIARWLDRLRRRCRHRSCRFYGLVETGTPGDLAAHVAVGTSLAAILPAALVSSLAHWRAGNTDSRFFREWGPGIVSGVVVAQLAAPHLRGSVMTGIFALLCLTFAIRFAFPSRFGPVMERPTGRQLPQHRRHRDRLVLRLGRRRRRHSHEHRHDACWNADAQEHWPGRCSRCCRQSPSTLVAALASGGSAPTRIGSIDLAVWASIAPAQTIAAWFGARLAQHVAADNLSRVVAGALITTGAVMFYSSIAGR